MLKGIRKNVTVPGLLAPALRLRFQEFGFRTLSPFAIDLVSYDLKSGARRSITLAIARDTLAAQDAVDAEIVARYRPGQPREGLLVQVIERLVELRSMARNAKPPPVNAKPERITFPARIWQLVDPRWEELGYASLSAYLTGLVRYDLLIGGPHQSRARYPEIHTGHGGTRDRGAAGQRSEAEALPRPPDRAHGRTAPGGERTRNDEIENRAAPAHRLGSAVEPRKSSSRTRRQP